MQRILTRALAALGLIAAATAPLAASAGWIYVPNNETVVAQVRPPFFPPAGWHGEPFIDGRVSYFSRFDMTIWHDRQPFAVRLHQGTIILPTGMTLQPGMRVRVSGHFGDGVLYADRIRLI